MTQFLDITNDLRRMGDAQKAVEMAAHYKTARVFLGVPALALDMMARDLRRDLAIDVRANLAQELWASNIHEACILAPKLLAQARIRPDDQAVWNMIVDWSQGLDCEALADHVAIAGAKRLQACPARLDELEAWSHSPNIWTRRAVLVMTLPFARLPHPKPQDLAVRDRVLDWAAGSVQERDPVLRKAIDRWLHELARRDPARVARFRETTAVPKGTGAPAPGDAQTEDQGPPASE